MHAASYLAGSEVFRIPFPNPVIQQKSPNVELKRESHKEQTTT